MAKKNFFTRKRIVWHLPKENAGDDVLQFRLGKIYESSVDAINETHLMSSELEQLATRDSMKHAEKVWRLRMLLELVLETCEALGYNAPEPNNG